VTKVVIVGAGKGGRALLEMFSGDPTVTIVGVVDVNPWAPGLELARRLNVQVSTDLRELIADPQLDLIIDVTGNPEVQAAIQRLKPASTEVMGGASAKFMWDLLAERKRTEELEDRYSLMLRELHAKSDGDFIIGQNPKMRELAEQIVRVAQTPTTVLIRGESGTGKELVARAIHRYSKPARQAARHRQLHRPDPDSHGVRALRAQAWVVHRSGGGQGRPVREGGRGRPSSWTRSATCRPRCRGSCSGSCRPGR